MTQAQNQLERLIKIFEKTFADKKFSRAEKKAVSQLLEEDYLLNKSQRDFLRGRIFDIAREGVQSHKDQAVIEWLETASKLLVDFYDHDSGSDIKSLSRAGIDIHVDNSPHYMHHKFAIFDNAKVLTGSYNWTRSAAEHNQENILVTDNKQVVTIYKEEFVRLWNSTKPFKGSLI